MKIELTKADYHDLYHATVIPLLMNAYATDPMGGGEALSEFVLDNLVEALADRSDAFSFIAFVDDQPAGLVNCFEAFSTFSCKPLVNIYDLVVLQTFRGLGLSQQLLQKVEEEALKRGCCKVTLEVLSGNEVAKADYQKFGCVGYELDPQAGQALFWQKTH